MPEIIDKIKFDLVYFKNDALVPAKAFSYKLDPKSRKPIEQIKPRTHSFENELKKDLSRELQSDFNYPTNKEVFISIVFGLHAKNEYKHCDLDNRIKTIFDALKGVVYVDDCQIKILWSHKEFLKNSECSYYQIAVKILDKHNLEYFGELSKNFR